MTPSKLPDNLWSLPSVHIPLDLDRIPEFPLLAQCLAVWRRTVADGLPSTIDPLDMPPKAIKGISLMEWREDRGDWIVRLSATLLDQNHYRSMKGTTFADALNPDELDRTHARVRAIMEAGEPNLARHEFSDTKGRIWSFVRLILPLSSDGVRRDRYCLVMDPDTFGQRIDRRGSDRRAVDV